MKTIPITTEARPALICAVGDSHGHLDSMYEVVEALEQQVGRTVDLVRCIE